MKVEVKEEEVPPEQAEPEPTEEWKVGHESKWLAHSLSGSEVSTNSLTRKVLKALVFVES